jgi:hypothetical protein
VGSDAIRAAAATLPEGDPPELLEQRNAGAGNTSLSRKEGRELRTNFFAEMKAKLAYG